MNSFNEYLGRNILPNECGFLNNSVLSKIERWENERKAWQSVFSAPLFAKYLDGRVKDDIFYYLTAGVISNTVFAGTEEFLHILDVLSDAHNQLPQHFQTHWDKWWKHDWHFWDLIRCQRYFVLANHTRNVGMCTHVSLENFHLLVAFRDLAGKQKRHYNSSAWKGAHLWETAQITWYSQFRHVSTAELRRDVGDMNRGKTSFLVA
jgi:hypothetical protein